MHALLNLKTAALNLGRNRRRTLASIVTLASAVAAILLFDGFTTSMYVGLRENLIRTQLGHVQVLPKGFETYGALNDASFLIKPQDWAWLEPRILALPHVVAASVRLESNAILTAGRGQMSANIIGIDPQKESVISSSIRIQRGSELFETDARGILLGQALAQALNMAVGDKLTLFGTDANQTVNAVDLDVVGIVTTGSKERDLRTAFVNLSTIRGFLQTQGISRIVLLLDDTERTEAAVAGLRDMVRARGYELRTWQDMAPYYHQVVALFDSIFRFVKLVLLALACFSVYTALSMSVAERTTEIAVIRAMGADRHDIQLLFLLEGAVLGVLGAACGCALSALIAELVNRSGVMMPTPPGSTVNYPMRIMVMPTMAATTTAWALLGAAASSALAATRASRINIVSALRYA